MQITTFTAAPAKVYYCSKYPWSADLVRQVQVIGKKDPSKAEDLYMKILFCNWSCFEVRKLAQAGLDVSRVIAYPGLLGGMLEGAELALRVTAGAIEIIMEGNKKQVLAQMESRLIPAKINIPGRGEVIGHHEGGRTLSGGKRSCCSLGLKRFHLHATGKGSFISSDVRYEGEFLENVFHDITGNAKLYIGATCYTGCFRDGKKCGHGKLDRYDEEINRYYLYYEGLFEGDHPKTGTVYNSSGEVVARCNDGVIEKPRESLFLRDSQGSLRSTESQSLKKQDPARQLFADVNPAVTIAPHSISKKLPFFNETREPYVELSSLVKAPSASQNGLYQRIDSISSQKSIEFSTPARRRSQSSTSSTGLLEEFEVEKSLERRSSAKDLPPEEICPLIAKKLANPRGELRLDESIELLTTCIRYGQERAEKIAGKEGVIVIGNTGAGKSTMVNFLSGCTMQLKTPKQLGLNGLDELVVVQPKAEGGLLDEVMPIGHKKESKTFMPQIETDLTEQITYCDCPGFLDNRGAEINIANAVNVKHAMSMAKGVKVIVLINYHSLKADRARGLNDLLKICTHLFGSSENIELHKDSLLFGISNAHISLGLESVRDWIVEDMPEIMQVLAERLFLFDPVDRPIVGAWNRSECVEQIKSLPTIENPSTIFKTVLTDGDEKKLITIGEEMKEEIVKALAENDFFRANCRLNHLYALSIIDHIAIERILDQAFHIVVQHFRKSIDEFRINCHFENFEIARNSLEKLKEGSEIFGERLRPVIDLGALHSYYGESEKRYAQRLEKDKEQQEKLDKAQTQIEKLIQLLEEQKNATEKELARQQMNFEQLVSQMQSRIMDTENSYTRLEVNLKRELQ